MSDPIRAHLVCGGKYHDIDFARKELLALLYEDAEIRTSVASDFRDTDAIAAADFLVTYTCSLDVVEHEERALAEFVRSGKRWLALHGTNSVLEFVKGGVAAPRKQQLLMRILGSQFIAHPPIHSYPVRVSKSALGHPLVAGIEPFEVDDELYLCEYHGEIQPLLETSFSGQAVGFIEKDWQSEEPRLVMYLHPEGEGQVLYLTLGHCRGKYDMRPVVKLYPRVERGAWQVPSYYELLRRGIRWAARRDV